MAKYCIFGAFGYVNIGDEVILDVVAQQLKTRSPGSDITALTWGRDTDRSQFLDEYRSRGIRLSSLFHPLRAMKLSAGRTLLIGGGQVIDGSWGVRLPLLQLLTAAWVKFTGGRVRVIGAGVSNATGPLVSNIYKMLFWLCDIVVLRDRDSFAAASKIGPQQKLRLGADVVFSAPSLVQAQSYPRRNVVVAVHNAPHVRHSSEDELVAIVSRLVDLRDNVEIFVAAHDVREDFDLGLARRVCERVPSSRLLVFNGPDECLEFYRSCACVISARMHPLIIGCISGAACIPLQGSAKVEYLAITLSLQIESAQSLSSMDEDLLRQRISAGRIGAPPEFYEIDMLRDAAASNFQGI